MSWEFYLARSSDLALLARITDASDKKLNPIFNQKGSFSCTIKIDSAAALLVEKWKHCLVVQKPNGTIAWSGPVVGIVDSAVAGTTTLTAQGWQAELDYRWIRSITELQDAVAYATPVPSCSNPSFETNTTGWTASGSVITRDTGTKNSGTASGRWDNNGSSTNLTAGDTLTTSFAGTFFAGVSYVLSIYIKASATSTGDFRFQFGDTASGDCADYTLAITTSFGAKNITWTPSTTYDAADLKLTAVTGGYYYWIDTISLTDSYHTATPTFDNPSFETNTTGWTATSSSITRDTSSPDSGSACGRWDGNGSGANLDITDSISGAITGTFFGGVTYMVKLKIKGSTYNYGRNPQPLAFTFGSGGDKGSTTRGLSTVWSEVSISWTPSLTATSATLDITSVLDGFYLWIDSCSVVRTSGSPQDTSFTNIDDGLIAEALVRLANLQTDSSGTVRATHLTPTGTATTPRTRTYQVGQNIGAAIKELSDIEDGFDIEVDPSTRAIAFVPNTSYTDRTGIVYGYNALPRNLEDVIVNDDGTVKANSINVQGAYTLGNADSPTDMANTGVLLEDWLTAADIKDESIVGAYANEELVFRSDGQTTLSVKPLPGAPIPYIDYDLGDQVYINADRGRMQLDMQAVRVFSASIGWNAQGDPIGEELGLTP